jgi:hypothetical protein
MQVFGDISIPGMDKDIKKALERGINIAPDDKKVSYNNSRFDMRCISSVMRIQSAVKCHCYQTQKQRTTVMQPAVAKTTQRQYRNTRHNDYSLLWPEKEIVSLF